MKILIVRLSAMGDIVHTLPLAANARAGGATVGWLTDRQYAGLLEGNPSIERIFLADTRRWRRNPFSPAHWAEVGNGIAWRWLCYRKRGQHAAFGNRIQDGFHIFVPPFK